MYGPSTRPASGQWSPSECSASCRVLYARLSLWLAGLAGEILNKLELHVENCKREQDQELREEKCVPEVQRSTMVMTGGTVIRYHQEVEATGQDGRF